MARRKIGQAIDRIKKTTEFLLPINFVWEQFKKYKRKISSKKQLEKPAVGANGISHRMDAVEGLSEVFGSCDILNS